MNRANHVRKFMHSIEAAFYLLGTILIEMSILIKVIFMKIREKRLLLWHRVIQVSTRMHITYQTVLRCILYLWEGMFIHWSVHLDPFPTLKLSVTLPAFSPPFCALLLPLYGGCYVKTRNLLIAWILWIQESFKTLRDSYYWRKKSPIVWSCHGTKRLCRPEHL